MGLDGETKMMQTTGRWETCGAAARLIRDRATVTRPDGSMFDRAEDEVARVNAVGSAWQVRVRDASGAMVAAGTLYASRDAATAAAEAFARVAPRSEAR